MFTAYPSEEAATILTQFYSIPFRTAKSRLNTFPQGWQFYACMGTSATSVQEHGLFLKVEAIQELGAHSHCVACVTAIHVMNVIAQTGDTECEKDLVEQSASEWRQCSTSEKLELLMPIDGTPVHIFFLRSSFVPHQIGNNTSSCVLNTNLLDLLACGQQSLFPFPGAWCCRGSLKDSNTTRLTRGRQNDDDDHKS